jgi:hypothetical protein
MLKTILALLFVCLTSCINERNIAGRYKSNFAVHGFFGTSIYLNSDSSFNYRMSGDLSYDTSIGHYTINGKYLELVHQEYPLDSAEYLKNREGYMLMYSLSYNRHLNDTTRYVIGNAKLFSTDSTGRKVSKKFGYSKQRQYFLFGKHWYEKRYFLKKQK